MHEQQYMLDVQPEYRERMKLALSLPYEVKLEKALLTIREYESAALSIDPENGYLVCDSYGKDSTVLVDLFRRAGVRFKAHHNLTTIDPPELIHFGRKFHPDTIVHRPKAPLLIRLVEKTNGPPTRIARWCCNEYKESTQGNACKVIGVRAEESPRRAAIWRTFTVHRVTGNLILSPILYWTADDIWRHIRLHNLPYCSLYDEGFTRLGCVGCPMAGNGRYREFARWPGYERAWKNAFRKFWDKWHGVPRKDGKPRWFDCARKDGTYFTKWEDLWTWWMEEEPEGEDSCQGMLF